MAVKKTTADNGRTTYYENPDLAKRLQKAGVRAEVGKPSGDRERGRQKSIEYGRQMRRRQGRRDDDTAPAARNVSNGRPVMNVVEQRQAPPAQQNQVARRPARPSMFSQRPRQPVQPQGQPMGPPAGYYPQPRNAYAPPPTPTYQGPRVPPASPGAPPQPQYNPLPQSGPPPGYQPPQGGNPFVQGAFGVGQQLGQMYQQLNPWSRQW